MNALVELMFQIPVLLEVHEYNNICQFLIGALCPAGKFCNAGTIEPEDCPEGKFRFETGALQDTDCSNCEPGFLCIVGEPIPTSCPAGQYCPAVEGSSETAIDCQLGTYSSRVQNKLAFDCTSCPEGYFCESDDPITDYTIFQCPLGFYCFERELDPVPCPQGTYRAEYGAGDVTECTICPEGFYCPHPQLGEDIGTIDPIACDPGTLCEEGSPIPKICEAGYYCSTE